MDITITFTLERVTGRFVSKEALSEEIIEAAGSEVCVDDSEYEITDTVVQ